MNNLILKLPTIARSIIFRRTVVAAHLFLMGNLFPVAMAQVPNIEPKYLNNSIPERVSTEKPLPGDNSITALAVHKDSQDNWIVTCEYFFNGVGQLPTFFNVNWAVGSSAFPAGDGPRGEGFTLVPQRGTHRVVHMLARPEYSGAITTPRVVARFFELNGNKQKDLLRQELVQAIHWPDQQTRQLDMEVRNKTSEEVLLRVVGLVDAGYSAAWEEARELLERLVRKDPKLDAAYLELARLAMKENWSQQGLRQAEAFIASARQIRPDSANALILQGYVQTHQGRFKEAEKAFQEAAKANPENLWLWANWGELLAKQGNLDLAIAKYRVALDRAPTQSPNDGARKDAFIKLFDIYEKRKDLDAIEALHKMRISDYGPGACFGTQYARFKVLARGDAKGGIALANDLLQSYCPGEQGKQGLGLAYYLAWANDDGAAKSEFLHQARVFYPVSPSLLFELASSDRTLDSAKQLIKVGEAVDQVDNRKLTALAYALSARNYEAVTRLLTLGAKTDKPVGPSGVPAAWIPIFSGDYAGIQLLRKRGVNYSNIVFQGTTAMDLAKRAGDKKMMDALSTKGPNA